MKKRMMLHGVHGDEVLDLKQNTAPSKERTAGYGSVMELARRASEIEEKGGMDPLFGRELE